MKNLLLLVLYLGSVAWGAKKPNVIVFFTDDHGWADLGIHGQRNDVKTPQMDRLAREGALCKQGYVTAPQCSPSRAGILSGRYQQRFGFEHNAMGPLPLDEKTLADRLKAGGYRTGFIGKWHLEPNWTMAGWTGKHLGVPNPTPKTAIPFEKLLPYYPKARGFDDFFKGELNRYWLNYGLNGADRNPAGEWENIKGYRLDIQTDAALAFIDRSKEKPFFLYVGYFAPHVPMEATEKYLKRFPGDMPERRRYALAMISAMDDGIGRIRERLAACNLDKDTLIFMIADNGAPLKISMEDIPVSFPGGAWDGSMNTPLNGEKGMVTEGGIHVPYIVCWPGTIPPGTVLEDPVISLDVTPTSLAAAGLPITDDLDGVDLLPRLTGKARALPERDLYWKFWNQAAIRRGDWKYMKISDGREWLFNLADDMSESQNLLEHYPERAEQLRHALDKQLHEFEPDHLRQGPVNDQEQGWFEFYLGSRRKPLSEIYAAMDANGDGLLSETEFVDGRTAREKPLLMEKHSLTEEQYQEKREGYRGSYRANFKKRDGDLNRVLDADELK